MKKKKNNHNGLNPNNPFCYEHVSVIENSTNLTLCLICEKSLCGDNHTNLSLHVRGSCHQKNLKKLFKMCVSDYPSDGNDSKYMKIISNSVFDLSILLKNESRYIHRYENQIVCLICEDIICEVRNCNDAVKEEIFGHIRSEQHLNSIRQNVCWVYRLETVPGFLMFHKTFTFCSVCNQTYNSEEDDTLRNAVAHLQTTHSGEMDYLTCDGSEEMKHTQHENFENDTESCLVGPCKESIRGGVFGETKVKRKGKSVSVDFLPYETIVMRLHELNLSNMYGNVNNISSKIEIIQRGNYHPFLITLQNHSSKKTTFCVVCKDIVTDILDSNVNDGITSHMSSPKHEESIKPILYQCIPDPFCEKSMEKYNELASVINNETGCVFQCENYIVCLICKKPITKLTQTFETIKYDLFYHFGSKQHYSIMRDNVWWFYYLQFSEVFIAFHSHVSQCTKCALNLESIPHRVVQCFQEHLLTEYPTLMGRNTLELNLQENTSHCNDLICFECNEAISIYNNDPEFSMNLHLESHRSLSEVNSHLNTEVSRETKYTCTVCLEEILIFNKDIELSVSLHGCSTAKMEPNLTQTTLNYDVSMVFDCIPDVFKVHRDLIILAEDDFYCKLCKCTVPLSKCFQDACKQVESHLTESYHKEQCDACKLILYYDKVNKKVDPWDLFKNTDDPDTLSSVKSVINENYQYIEKCKYYYFCKVCKCCFLHFENEQEVMKIFASHFMCKNHKKKLGKYINQNECNDDDRNDENTFDETKETFSSQSVGEVNTNESKVIFDKLKCLPGYQLNSQFFAVQGNLVCCKLCKISIPSNQKTQVRKHCYSECHSMILAKNAEKYIMSHGNNQLANAGNPCHKKFVDVLKNLAESYYRINNPTITPNLLYIDNNGKSFFCLLCNINIKFSGNGSTLVTHFMTKIHKQNLLSLNCNIPSNTIKHGSTKNQLELPMKVDENGKMMFSNNQSPIKEKEIVSAGVSVSDFFEKLPEEYSVFKDFILVEGKDITCHLCGIALFPKNNFEGDCKTLQDHMSSPGHKELYLLYKSNSSGQIVDPWERFEDGSSETRLEVQQLNEKNKEHLEKGKTYFSCSLCGAYFLYFDEKNMKNIFAAHCLTAEHVKHLKQKKKKEKKKGSSFMANSNKCFDLQLDAQSLSRHSDGCDMRNDTLKRPKSSLVISLNHLYIRLLDNQVFCDICQVFINITENESHLKKHCYSPNHNTILMKYAVDFIEGLDENSTIRKITRSRSRLTNVLSKMAKTAYIQRNNSLVANLLYISYDTREFLCFLCNKSVKFTENGGTVMGHILSREHARNVLKLNCIFKFHNPSVMNEAEELEEIISDDSISELNISSRVFTSQMGHNQSNNENIEINSEEHSYTLGTGQNILEISLDENQLRLQSTENLDVSELMANDSTSERTELKCDGKALEESCSDCSSEEARELCMDQSLEKQPNNPFSHDRLCCNDSSNTEMEIKSTTLTWNLVSIEVSSVAFDEHFEYECPDCNEVIPIINKDVMMSFEMHYKASHLNIEELLTAHEEMAVNKKYLRELFECIPDSLGKYMKNISLKSDTLFCSMCKSFIKTKKRDIFETAVQLYFHLSSKLHQISDKSQLLKTESTQPTYKCQPEVNLFLKNSISEKPVFEKLPLDTKQSPGKQGNHEESSLKNKDLSRPPRCEELFSRDTDDSKNVDDNFLTEKVQRVSERVCSEEEKQEKIIIGQATERPFPEEVGKLEFDFSGLEVEDSHGDTHKSEDLSRPPRCEELFSRDTDDSKNVDDNFLTEKVQRVSKRVCNEEDKQEKIIIGQAIERSFPEEVGKLEFGFGGLEVEDSHGDTHKSEDSSEESTKEGDKIKIMSSALRDTFKTFSENLTVHQEFLSLNKSRITCKLCSSALEINDVKNHITDFTHRHKFLAEIKKRVGTDVKQEVRRLMFISSQLYCGLCQCYITPWSDFDGICQGVSSHLKVPAHKINNS